MTKTTRTPSAYVLYIGNGRRHFAASSDRQAKGMARRLMGRRPHSTFPLGRDFADAAGLRPVGAWNLGAAQGCDTAALYAVL